MRNGDLIKQCFALKDNYDKNDYNGSICDICKHCEIVGDEVVNVEDFFCDCYEKIVPIRYCHYYNDIID